MITTQYSHHPITPLPFNLLPEFSILQSSTEIDPDNQHTRGGMTLSRNEDEVEDVGAEEEAARERLNEAAYQDAVKMRGGMDD